MAGRAKLRRPVVVGAFEGWNDAADAATAVIDHIASSYPTDLIFELDSDDYYDYQMVRPQVVNGDDGREIVWPTTSVSVSHLPGRDVVLLKGRSRTCTGSVSARPWSRRSAASNPSLSSCSEPCSPTRLIRVRCR